MNFQLSIINYQFSMKIEFDKYRRSLKQEGILYLNVKVIPKAQRTELAGLMVGTEGEEILKIKVAAVPEKGKANAELCKYLAKELGVLKSSVIVSQGQTSQRKVVRVCRS